MDSRRKRERTLGSRSLPTMRPPPGLFNLHHIVRQKRVTVEISFCSLLRRLAATLEGSSGGAGIGG
ncbi:cysteine synthase [Sesbania bispinosa]|nr:cysteine synthase [Sesbania bispinosa]